MLDEDRLMLDRSPDELGSHGNDMDELCASDSDLDDDANETTTDGERIIYPWMKKIHVAGVGEFLTFSLLLPLYRFKDSIFYCNCSVRSIRVVSKHRVTFVNIVVMKSDFHLQRKNLNSYKVPTVRFNQCLWLTQECLVFEICLNK